jgi:UDP-xylose/UDP-N-acetylglucosamine transporter B4
MESSQAANRDYLIGIGLLSGALVVAAFLGLWQEETYRQYGAAWREALFYSVRPFCDYVPS